MQTAERPLYYLHHANPYTTGWEEASRYRISNQHLMAILGGEKEEEIALTILQQLSPPTPSPAIEWSNSKKEECRQAHASFFPSATRLQPGLVVNARYPWLSCTIDDFTWSEDGLERGLCLYKAPYTKLLYKNPLPAHELQMAYAAAVCEWNHPFADYVVWTPAASLVKRYEPGSVLVQDVQLTLRELWDSFVWPRLQAFNDTYLQPLVQQYGLQQEKIYDCNNDNYIAVY